MNRLFAVGTWLVNNWTPSALACHNMLDIIYMLPNDAPVTSPVLHIAGLAHSAWWGCRVGEIAERSLPQSLLPYESRLPTGLTVFVRGETATHSISTPTNRACKRLSSAFFHVKSRRPSPTSRGKSRWPRVRQEIATIANPALGSRQSFGRMVHMPRVDFFRYWAWPSQKLALKPSEWRLPTWPWVGFLGGVNK